MEKTLLYTCLIGVLLILVGGAFSSVPFVYAIFTDGLNKGDGVALVVRGTGEFTCRNESQFKFVDLFILLSEKDSDGNPSNTSGMGLKTQDNTRLGSGLIAGSINAEGFEVEGTVIVDEICEEELISVIASGNCGSSSTVTLSTATGSKGTFHANVNCI